MEEQIARYVTAYINKAFEKKDVRVSFNQVMRIIACHVDLFSELGVS